MKNVCGKTYISKPEAIKHARALADYAGALEARLALIADRCREAERAKLWHQRGFIAQIHELTKIPDAQKTEG